MDEGKKGGRSKGRCGRKVVVRVDEAKRWMVRGSLVISRLPINSGAKTTAD